MIVIDKIDLKLITYAGRPVALAYGDGDHVHNLVLELYREKYGRFPYEETDPYYGRKFQTSGGYTPARDECWQLRDGRRLIILEVRDDQVIASHVRDIGYQGAPGFYEVEISISDLDGARVWE